MILDNESTPILAIDDQTVTEGAGGSFTVSLDTAYSTDTTVNFSVNDVTAVGGGTDYTATTGTPVTIPANTLSTTIDFTTVDDVLYENSETFTVDIGSATNALGNPTIGDNQGLGTITDNEATPDITIDDVVEGRHFEDDVMAYGFHDLAPRIQIKEGHTYGIPYRALRVAGLDNLLAAGMLITSNHNAHMSSCGSIYLCLMIVTIEY